MGGAVEDTALLLYAAIGALESLPSVALSFPIAVILYQYMLLP